MSPALLVKAVLVVAPFLLFLRGWFRRDGEVELNHLLAALFVAALPTSLFALEWEVPFVAPWLAFYFGLYIISAGALLYGPLPRRPLSETLVQRLADQLGRILNEEALFRGLLFLVPYSVWGKGDDWFVWALPQALLFALAHAFPVFFSLMGRGRLFRALLGGFAFPFAGALTFAYLGATSGGLLLPILLHYLTNFAAELGFELLGWRTEFAFGAGKVE